MRLMERDACKPCKREDAMVFCMFTVSGLTRHAPAAQKQAAQKRRRGADSSSVLDYTTSERPYPRRATTVSIHFSGAVSGRAHFERPDGRTIASVSPPATARHQSRRSRLRGMSSIERHGPHACAARSARALQGACATRRPALDPRPPSHGPPASATTHTSTDIEEGRGANPGIQEEGSTPIQDNLGRPHGLVGFHTRV